MSCATIPNRFTNPVLHAKIIQDFQERFDDQLQWLEKVYPLARVGETKKEDGSTFRYPQVYVNDGGRDYYDLRPDDNLSCFGFFEMNDAYPVNVDQSEVGFNISFIVWYNLKKLDNGKNYDYSAELLAHVLKVLENYTEYSSSITDLEIEPRPEEVFSKYSFEQTDNQYLMYPFGAFKLSFTIADTINADCFDDFNITGGGSCND